MTDARIGRIVAAAVHQAVADQMPMQLDFYEHYLKPMRFRQPNLGAASFAAALSFLRQEADAYDPIVARAGRYAADWTFAAAPRVRRAVWQRLPCGLRTRAALRLARQVVADAAPGSPVRSSYRGHEGRLDIKRSPFCEVRKPADAPLCGYFASALEALCGRLRVPAQVRIVGCRATGEPYCLLALDTALPTVGRLDSGHSPEVA
jgi:hypothetical protein